MRCVFCDDQAVSYHRFQQEMPPEPDEFGDMWRKYRLVGEMFGFCRRHGRQFDRYNFYVREVFRPDTDEYLGDGKYQTPSGHVYRVIEDFGGVMVSHGE